MRSRRALARLCERPNPLVPSSTSSCLDFGPSVGRSGDDFDQSLFEADIFRSLTKQRKFADGEADCTQAFATVECRLADSRGAAGRAVRSEVTDTMVRRFRNRGMASTPVKRLANIEP